MKRLIRLASLAIVLAALSSPATAQQRDELPPELITYPNLIFYNGTVITMDDKSTTAEAVAVRDGKFLAVGTSERIRRMAGPETRQVDLKGGSVIPGFIDTHLHLGPVRTDRKSLPLTARTPVDLKKQIAELAAKATPGEWLLVDTIKTNILTRKDLDEIAPNNPLEMKFPPGEEPVILNSQALKIANLPPDIPGMDKDPQGNATGVLWGYAAGVVEYEVIPLISPAERIPMFAAAMKDAAAVGLTTVYTRSDANGISAIKEMWLKDQLTLRWRLGSEMIRMNPNAESLMKRVGNLDMLGDDMFRLSGLQPGNPDNNYGIGAYTRRPPQMWYPGAPKGELMSRGYDKFGQNYWNDLEHSGHAMIILGNRYGWDMRGTHVAGDRAVDMMLDAYEKADKENPVAGRAFAIDHGAMIRPDHIPRLKKLDVIVSMAPKYLFADGSADRLMPIWGGDEMQRWSPARTLIDAGIRVVAEADTEGEAMSPLWGLEKFVTRTDDKGRVWGKDEKLTREEALRTYTIWAAEYTREKDTLGSIEPGKLADLVVLGENYLKVPENRISLIPVLMTVVGGRVVFEKTATDKPTPQE